MRKRAKSSPISIPSSIAPSFITPKTYNTNTCIIIDDIVSWADSFKRSSIYMRCQLTVCRAYRLSLNLGKSHFFPRRFEFVGIDVLSYQVIGTWIYCWFYESKGTHGKVDSLWLADEANVKPASSPTPGGAVSSPPGGSPWSPAVMGRALNRPERRR